MVSSCSYVGCKSVEGKVELYKMPSDLDLLGKWLEAVRCLNISSYKTISSYRVCRHHFLPSDFDQGALKPDAVPQASRFMSKLDYKLKTQRSNLEGNDDNITSCRVAPAYPEPRVTVSYVRKSCAMAGCPSVEGADSCDDIEFVDSPGTAFERDVWRRIFGLPEKFKYFNFSVCSRHDIGSAIMRIDEEISKVCVESDVKVLPPPKKVPLFPTLNSAPADKETTPSKAPAQKSTELCPGFFDQDRTKFDRLGLMEDLEINFGDPLSVIKAEYGSDVCQSLILKEYPRWIFMKVMCNDWGSPAVLYPSPLIDFIWRSHFLNHSEHYLKTCVSIQKFVSNCTETVTNHLRYIFPYDMKCTPSQADKMMRLTEILYRLYFDEDPDNRFWWYTMKKPGEDFAYFSGRYDELTPFLRSSALMSFRKKGEEESSDAAAATKSSPAISIKKPPDMRQKFLAMSNEMRMARELTMQKTRSIQKRCAELSDKLRNVARPARKKHDYTFRYNITPHGRLSRVVQPSISKAKTSSPAKKASRKPRRTREADNDSSDGEDNVVVLDDDDDDDLRLGEDDDPEVLPARKKRPRLEYVDGKWRRQNGDERASAGDKLDEIVKNTIGDNLPTCD